MDKSWFTVPVGICSYIVFTEKHGKASFFDYGQAMDYAMRMHGVIVPTEASGSGPYWPLGSASGSAGTHGPADPAA